MARYQAAWDSALKVSTGAFLLLMTGMAAGAVALDVRLGADGDAFRWGLLLVPALLAVIPGAWLLAPRGYAIEGGELTVDRPLFPVRIPLASIRGVSLVDRKQAGMLVKVAGSGGVFGHYGRYYSRGLGAFRLYATRRDHLVVIDTDSGRFVLTPATPERFVEELRRDTSAAAVAAARRSGVGPARVPWRLALAILVSVPLLIGAILGAAWGRAPRAAVVEADAVRIDHRWGDPVRIPLAGIRAVGPLPEPLTQGWRRIHGVGGLGDAAYGRFHSARLGPFTLYAWRRGPYVVLTTDAGTVVLTPDDPAAFVAEVRRRLPP